MAEVQVLSDGYIKGEDDERVAGTVSFVRDGEALIVVDPGMVAARSNILDPLAALGVTPDNVTDVIFSHHHPDHTMNAALFPNAKVHDVWATYVDDLWIDREAEGFSVSPDVRLIETPGHTPEDISTVIETDDGLVVCTHVWWMASGPAEDPYATDAEALSVGRRRILDLPGLALVVPGHGSAFVPDDDTPR